MELQKHLDQIEKIKDSIIKELTDELNKVEQNKDVESINDNCFTMPLSKLDKNMSLTPITYDFKASCKVILKHIPKDVQKIESYFKTIIESKKLPTSYVNRNLPDTYTSKPLAHDRLIEILKTKLQWTKQ